MYCIIDIETTWLSREFNHITEIAAVKFDGKRIVWKRESLVNPQVPIPPNITRITWIDNDMVAHAPVVEEILPDFIEFLNDDVFVAHNIGFDRGFIQANLTRHHDYKMTNPKLCTRKLWNRILSHLPSKSLGNLCNHYGIINTTAHRAMSDVLATVEVLKCFLDRLQILEWHKHYPGILDFQQRPIKRCQSILRANSL